MADCQIQLMVAEVSMASGCRSRMSHFRPPVDLEVQVGLMMMLDARSSRGPVAAGVAVVEQVRDQLELVSKDLAKKSS